MLDRDVESSRDDRLPEIFSANRLDHVERLSWLRGRARRRCPPALAYNYKGQDAKQFRHYGPVAQDFYAAFGHDAVGTVGTPTTITSGDLDGILMLATQALEKRTVEQEKEIAQLKVRLEALEQRGCEVAANVTAGL